MSKSNYNFLLGRRSVLVQNLCEPGPGRKKISKILDVAVRVPDHKIQTPWRFIVFHSRKSRKAFGKVLVQALEKQGKDLSDQQKEVERGRFLRAPLVIAVISSPKEKPGVPDWEQYLSAGAVCQNLSNAVAALGFASQWVTEWYAYDETVQAALGLEEQEQVAGFIYIGTAKEPPKERRRAKAAELTVFWAGE